MKTYIVSVLAIFVLALGGCNPPEVTNSPKNNTWRLDETAKNGTQQAAFVDSVKRFYQALQDKDWPTTYDMRFSDFKHDVPWAIYLKQVADGGRGWTLDSFKVLNLEMFGDTNGNYYAAQMIMEFTEVGKVSYGAAWWRNEGGKWFCEETGASGLAWLRSTRPPPWLNN